VPDELPPLTIREYQPGDEQAILATFNAVFAAVDPTFVPRTLENWRWQYMENPSGWRIKLAVTDEGHVVSQYAGVGQRVLLDGEPALFSQAVDSMTDPAFRRGLRKPGFFVLTGYPYAEDYGGPPPDRDTVMWGLPVPPAWRIGKTYLKYEMVRSQLKLTADPADLRVAAAPGIDVAEVDEYAPLAGELESLFARAAAPHGAIAVRDAAQLDWRFVRHPEREYRRAVARRGGELVGLAVFRVGGFDGEEQGLVCDWLVPPDEPEAAHALRAWLRDCARAAGAERLVALLPDTRPDCIPFQAAQFRVLPIPDTCPDWIPFQAAQFRVLPTRYFLVGRNYVKRYDMRWLYRHWYYTLGDTDLV
jgi:hypothetical protein